MDKSKKRKWRTRKIKKKRNQNRTKDRRRQNKIKKTKQISGGDNTTYPLFGSQSVGVSVKEQLLICSLFPYVTEDIGVAKTRNVYLSDNQVKYDGKNKEKYEYTYVSSTTGNKLMSSKVIFRLNDINILFTASPGIDTYTYKIKDVDSEQYKNKYLFVSKMVDINLNKAFRFNINYSQTIKSSALNTGSSIKSGFASAKTSILGNKQQNLFQEGGGKTIAELFQDNKLLLNTCENSIQKVDINSDYTNLLRFLVNYKSKLSEEIIENLIKNEKLDRFLEEPHLAFYSDPDNNDFYYFLYDKVTLDLNGYDNNNIIVNRFVKELIEKNKFQKILNSKISLRDDSNPNIVDNYDEINENEKYNYSLKQVEEPVIVEQPEVNKSGYIQSIFKSKSSKQLEDLKILLDKIGEQL